MPRTDASTVSRRRNARWTPLVLALFLASGCATVHEPGPAASGERASLGRGPFAHDDFDGFLARHVDAHGRVDYAGAQKDRTDLDRYLVRIATTSPDHQPHAFPTPAHRLAYWLNAYNAWAIAIVLDHYPIASVRDVRSPAPLDWVVPDLAGFFFFQHVPLGGESISLYELENGVVRERFADPRLHFALNCASLGCPRLPAEAFRPARLEDQLDRETRRFLGEARNVEVLPNLGVVRLSSIFDWYESDFTSWVETQHAKAGASLLDYVALAHPDPRALDECGACRVEFVEYDWGLNDRRKEKLGKRS